MIVTSELGETARYVLTAFREAGHTIVTAESCTGGLIAALLTDVAGSSDVYERGFVTYSNEAKMECLGVREEILAQHGAVSAETAMAMAEGALGISSALIYAPDMYADTAELIALAQAAAEYDGIYITHLRSEGARFLEALDEFFTIIEQAKIRGEIYHLKAAGPRNWHKLAEVIRRVEAKQAAGWPITADMYPYHASGTGLTAVLPPWSMADGKLYDNLRDPAMRAKIKAEALNPSGGWEAMAALCGAACGVVAAAPPRRRPRPRPR